jgi:hypothetical protein
VVPISVAPAGAGCPGTLTRTPPAGRAG